MPIEGTHTLPELRHSCCNSRASLHLPEQVHRSNRHSNRGQDGKLIHQVSACTISLELGRRLGGEWGSYRSRVLISRAPPPSASDANLTLFTPCITPTCCSPETSMTSRVSSSQGMRGKVMLRCISIFSPVGANKLANARTAFSCPTNLCSCLQSTLDAQISVCSPPTLPILGRGELATSR